MVEIRCRLAKLMAEIMPDDINGFLFPTGGAEANEAAVRIARRFTGRRKVISLYRSYHGGTATALSATGDFRRWFAEYGEGGFVKAFNPTPINFSWGGAEHPLPKLMCVVLHLIICPSPHRYARARNRAGTRSIGRANIHGRPTKCDLASQHPFLLALPWDESS